MKRCNNCGWFNLDATMQCEKCGEESFEQVAEIADEATKVAPTAVETPMAENTPAPQIKEESKVEAHEHVATPNHFASATIAFGSNMSTPSAQKSTTPMPEPAKIEQKPRNNFKATVAIGSDMPMPEPAKVEQKPHNNFKATVAIGSNMPMPEPAKVEQKPRNNFKATVAIGSDTPILNTPSKAEERKSEPVAAQPVATQCPKCCYPITGHVEYCPNCGTTIKNTPNITVSEHTERGETNSRNNSFAKTVLDFSSSLKATVAETVDNSRDDEGFLLVQLDAPNTTIKLRLGEVVVINGIRYKFEK